MPRVLHVLSQRPSLTGSGITLDSVARHAAAAGWEQHVIVGVPAGESLPDVGGFGPRSIHPLRFGDGGDLPFPVPGMSDVMPYASTVFSSMPAGEVETYRHTWRRHLRAAPGRSLDKPPPGDPTTTMPEALRPMTWAAVFERIESVWRELLDARWPVAATDQ